MPETDADPVLTLMRMVRDMRRWQREFFKAKDPNTRANAVARAKPLEHQVDRLLDELDPPASQPTLFPPEPRGTGAYGQPKGVTP